MQLSGGFLSRVEAHASCVLDASIDLVWAVLRDWGSLVWLKEVDGRPLRSSVVEGSSNTCVGAIRMVEIGAHRMFERLNAVDDDKHCMKWQVISHPDTINPFPASLVNYVCTLKLLPVTVGNKTLIDWQGVLFTEMQSTMTMKATLERWYLTGFQSLQEYVAQRSHTLPQKQCVPQVGTVDYSPWAVGLAGSSVGVSVASGAPAASPGLTQASSSRSAPAAIPRSVYAACSLEGVELHPSQRAAFHRTMPCEESLGQAMGRIKGVSIDSDVLMGRSLSWGDAALVHSAVSSLQSLERGSLLGSLPEALPGSNSNSSSTVEDGAATPWVSANTLAEDTLNTLIAGGRSGTLSRAELRTQLSGLCGGPVTREEIQLLEMLRDAKALAATGGGECVSAGLAADAPMARTASADTAAASSSGNTATGSRAGSEELPPKFETMHLEAHPILAP